MGPFECTMACIACLLAWISVPRSRADRTGVRPRRVTVTLLGRSGPYPRVRVRLSDMRASTVPMVAPVIGCGVSGGPQKMARTADAQCDPLPCSQVVPEMAGTFVVTAKEVLMRLERLADA